MLERNWKYQLLLLCLAKLWRRIVGSGASNKIKTKLACILEASESTRTCVWENLYQIIMKDHICRKKGNTSFTALHFGSQIYSLRLKAITIPAAKAAVDKQWQKLEKISAWKPDKSQKQKRGDRWSKDVGRKSFILHHWWTYVIWRMPKWSQKHQK